MSKTSPAFLHSTVDLRRSTWAIGRVAGTRRLHFRAVIAIQDLWISGLTPRSRFLPSFSWFAACSRRRILLVLAHISLNRVRPLV